MVNMKTSPYVTTFIAIFPIFKVSIAAKVVNGALFCFYQISLETRDFNNVKKIVLILTWNQKQTFADVVNILLKQKIAEVGFASCTCSQCKNYN